MRAQPVSATVSPVPPAAAWPPAVPLPEPGIDPGAIVVRHAHTMLRLDASWSLLGGRGFTWRVGDLVQRVWWEPGVRGADGTPDRVIAQIELVRGIADAALAAAMANALNGICSLGALVADPVRHTIVARTAAWVDRDSIPAVSHRFAVAVGLQSADAANLALLLAEATEGRVARSLHPGFAARVAETPYPMERLATIAGREPSRWTDGGLVPAGRAVAALALAGLVVAEEGGVAMPLPFGDDVADLRLTTDEIHPLLGRGLTVRLTLPPDAVAVADAAVAAELNRLEFASATRADLHGAWVAGSGQLRHIAFHPNVAHTTTEDAAAILRSDIERARWVADALS